MSYIRNLVTNNPMTVEITRFRRKYFSPRGGSFASVVLALIGVVYLGLLALVWNFREEAHPVFLVILQTGVFTLLAPAMLHGSIAGERERRSWDFLLVAPVTHGQIVAGKFLGSVVAVLIGAAFFVLPIGIGVLFYAPSYTDVGVNIGNLIEAELLSVTWGIFVCAMTIFFSGRCRRGFIALGATLGVLIASLIVWPVLTAASGGMTMELHLLNFFHPFWALAQIAVAGSPEISYTDSGAFSWMFGIPQILVYLGLSFVLLAWTERTLRFADNDVKFLPKTKDA